MRPASVRTSHEARHGAAVVMTFFVDSMPCGCSRQYFTAETQRVQRTSATQSLHPATRESHRPGGLVRAGHKGNEAVARPRLCR